MHTNQWSHQSETTRTDDVIIHGYLWNSKHLWHHLVYTDICDIINKSWQELMTSSLLFRMLTNEVTWVTTNSADDFMQNIIEKNLWNRSLWIFIVMRASGIFSGKGMKTTLMIQWMPGWDWYVCLWSFRHYFVIYILYTMYICIVLYMCFHINCVNYLSWGMEDHRNLKVCFLDKYFFCCLHPGPLMYSVYILVCKIHICIRSHVQLDVVNQIKILRNPSVSSQVIKFWHLTHIWHIEELLYSKQ